MIHGKKMTLVPIDEKPQAPFPAGSYTLMDGEMNKILADKKLSDFEKFELYDQVLQRYKFKMQKDNNVSNFVDGAENDMPLASISDYAAPKMEQEEQIEDDVSAKDLEQKPKLNSYKNIAKDVLNIFSAQAKKKKAVNLFNLITNISGVEYNSAGEIIVNGKMIGQVLPLIKTVLQPKKVVTPVGWSKFMGFLKNINIPESYITNRELKSRIKPTTPRQTRRTNRDVRRRTSPQKWIQFI